jgi:hypothetical protein
LGSTNNIKNNIKLKDMNENIQQDNQIPKIDSEEELLRKLEELNNIEGLKLSGCKYRLNEIDREIKDNLAEQEKEIQHIKDRFEKKLNELRKKREDVIEDGRKELVERTLIKNQEKFS